MFDKYYCHVMPPPMFLKALAMSTPRLSFTSRNDWFFAVATLTLASSSYRVLCERRLLDGAVVAEWDHSTNTGWMRAGLVTGIAVPATLGKSINLGEAVEARRRPGVA